MTPIARARRPAILPRALGSRAAGLALTIALAWLPWSAAPARAGSPTVDGIDVSQYQDTIDWPSVNPGRVGFVIMRATKGEGEVDTAYATNLAGATAEGFVVGAYHRATPSATPGDAVAEADHFLATARDAAGDLIPALDIEETGGLSVHDLRAWVRTWLARVTHRLGVRPMIYSSPNFWRTNLGDSRWFADHGYPLWIAHWYVPAPDVFADGWGGRGWTFWQWTSTGSVSGIPTDVDRDRYDGATLTMARIASLTVTAAPGGTIGGDRIDCGDAATSCSRLANPGDPLTLTATPDPGATLLGWTGACVGAGTAPTCTVTAIGDRTVSAVFGYPLEVTLGGTGGGTVMSGPIGIDCSSDCTGLFPASSAVTLTEVADSASTFASWSGACAGSGATCDVTIDGPRSVGARFDANLQLAEDGTGTSFAWAPAHARDAIGHTYRWERSAGATATYAFAGGSVRLITVDGPAMGRASVAIDGSPEGTFDGYAPSLRYGVEHRFDRLGPGDHAITVTALGTARMRATGTRVAIDALRSGGVLDPTPRATSAAWGSVDDASAGGGSYVASDAPGATATLAFTGTGVTLITSAGPDRGIAEIRVDGALVRTVDLYGATATSDVRRSVVGLEDGPHVVTVTVTGDARAHATGALIGVDGWIVR